MPLKSLDAYSQFVAQAFNRPEVERSTVAVWSDSPFTGTAEGEVFFSNSIRLRIREELDFEAGIIASYGYEVYRGEESGAIVHRQFQWRRSAAGNQPERSAWAQ